MYLVNILKENRHVQTTFCDAHCLFGLPTLRTRVLNTLVELMLVSYFVAVSDRIIFSIRINKFIRMAPVQNYWNHSQKQIINNSFNRNPKSKYRCKLQLQIIYSDSHKMVPVSFNYSVPETLGPLVSVKSLHTVIFLLPLLWCYAFYCLTLTSLKIPVRLTTFMCLGYVSWSTSLISEMVIS